LTISHVSIVSKTKVVYLLSLKPKSCIYCSR